MPTQMQNMRYASSSPTQAAQGGLGVNRHMYDQLKQQVQQLKVEQRAVHETKAQHKELETAALLKQKLAYEEQLQAQAQELASLQLRLKDTLERASKVRQHAEKEKKALTQQVEKLQQSLEQGAHAQQQAHLQQLQEIRDTLQQRQEEWANERQALQHQQAQFMREVEEWSQGEVEAIQAAAASRLQQEQESVVHWREQYQLAKALLEDAQAQITGLQQQLDLQQQRSAAELRQSNTAAAIQKQQLESVEQKLLEKQQQLAQEQQHWHQQLALVQREHAAQGSQVKAQHTLELDAVQVKLQGVLQKKDNTIATLHEQLMAAMAKLQCTEDELLELQADDD